VNPQRRQLSPQRDDLGLLRLDLRREREHRDLDVAGRALVELEVRSGNVFGGSMSRQPSETPIVFP
jgi:hypothetical protein